MIHDILTDAAHVHSLLHSDTNIQEQIQQLADACIAAIKNNHKVILCGNGGSFADAQHIAAELVGRFLKERHALPAICLGCNASSTSAIGNDYSFDDIFARELSAVGQAGDVLIGISTSGNSSNVLKAIHVANAKGIHAFGLTGNTKGAITRTCNCIEVPSNHTPRIQECHILVGHIVCELIDAAVISP
ncbi:MAG: SIS domain-containing protein [Candidatus Margulisbacteria bacterium]|nr:SIS domain-containing protein [Candidatus Margulisiibacteriota bacterium]